MAGLKVLIVDDEEELVTTIAERLRIRGMSVEYATDGETALKMINENPPLVIVLDVMMPGMGGIEVLQRIKGLNLQIPVLLLTGYGSNEQGQQGLKFGAFDYLMKPCDLNVLIKKINEAVSVNK